MGPRPLSIIPFVGFIFGGFRDFRVSGRIGSTSSKWRIVYSSLSIILNLILVTFYHLHFNLLEVILVLLAFLFFALTVMLR